MNKTFYILPTLIFFFCCSNTSQQDNSNKVNVPGTLQETATDVSSQVSLPDSAQAFIQQHFESAELQYVKEKKSPKAEGTFYEVRLKNDIEIDFGRAGNWIEVKAEGAHPIPTTFFPQQIQTYLKSNYSNVDVESIDKTKNGYELELTNDIKVYFGLDGVFLKQKN